MMKITSWIILLAPAGVCFLVAGQLLAMKDIAKEFQKIGWYFLVVIVGLAIHAFLVLPLLYTIICRKLPFRSILALDNSRLELPVQVHRQPQPGPDDRLGHLLQLRHAAGHLPLPGGEERSGPEGRQAGPAYRSHRQHGRDRPVRGRGGHLYRSDERP